MPRKTTKTSLSAKLGSAGRKAVEGHSGDETKLSAGGDLPAGIENGIAKLVDCRFGEFKKGDNKGEPFFMAAGVVMEPTHLDKLPIEGQRTQIGPEAICDTPTKSRKTVDEHIDWVMNQMRKLGYDTADMSIDDLEDAVAALKEAAPCFRFRTWKGEKQTTGKYAGQEPMVQHDWGGFVEYEADSDDDGVDDNTGEVKEEDIPFEKAEDVGSDLTSLADAADNEDEAASVILAEKAKLAGVPEDDVANANSWGDVVEMIIGAEEDTEPEPGAGVLIDFPALGEAADEGDEAAIMQLTSEAEEAGIEIADDDTWSELADKIFNEDLEDAAAALKEAAPRFRFRTRKGEKQTTGKYAGQEPMVQADGQEPKEDTGHPDDWKPEKGEVYGYKPPRARKPVECDVTAVFGASRKVNLKNLDTEYTYKSVSWDDLVDI